MAKVLAGKELEQRCRELGIDTQGGTAHPKRIWHQSKSIRL